jgi:hypothetical protein
LGRARACIQALQTRDDEAKKKEHELQAMKAMESLKAEQQAAERERPQLDDFHNDLSPIESPDATVMAQHAESPIHTPDSIPRKQSLAKLSSLFLTHNFSIYAHQKKHIHESVAQHGS